jgi:hypothetical protein
MAERCILQFETVLLSSACGMRDDVAERRKALKKRSDYADRKLCELGCKGTTSSEDCHTSSTLPLVACVMVRILYNYFDQAAKCKSSNSCRLWWCFSLTRPVLTLLGFFAVRRYFSISQSPMQYSMALSMTSGNLYCGNQAQRFRWATTSSSARLLGVRCQHVFPV